MKLLRLQINFLPRETGDFYSMLKILNLIATLVIAANAAAQVPPDKIVQPDGTIQLVPKPPARVLTPYYIDPTMQFQIYMDCQWANRSWSGSNKNGLIAYKDEVVTADVLAMPIPKTKVVNGKTVQMFSVYRSSDVVIQYDSTRLELMPVVPAAFGPAFDPKVMDASKVTQTQLADGVLLFHSEALKAPELRTPALAPLYYQWNFGGYLWSGGYRLLGKIQFKVKDDYYLPSWGQQRSFIRVLDKHNDTVTRVDGSPVDGTNILKEIRSQGEQIMFGVPPAYKVSHYLSAATTKFNVGDTVKVSIMVKPDSKPQLLSSVATNFAWDPTILEFTGLDKTGSPPSMDNSMYMPGPGNINESSIPKDGNACHVWLSQLGDRRFYDKETLIVTLNFKVLSAFATTNVDILSKNDPRLVGISVLDDSMPIGSSKPGSTVLGSQRGITIYGTN